MRWGGREGVMRAKSIVRTGRGVCVPAEGGIEGTHGPLPRLLAIPVSRISTSGSGRGAKILRWGARQGWGGGGRSTSDSREREILYQRGIGSWRMHGRDGLNAWCDCNHHITMWGVRRVGRWVGTVQRCGGGADAASLFVGKLQDSGCTRCAQCDDLLRVCMLRSSLLTAGSSGSPGSSGAAGAWPKGGGGGWAPVSVIQRYTVLASRLMVRVDCPEVPEAIRAANADACPAQPIRHPPPCWSRCVGFVSDGAQRIPWQSHHQESEDISALAPQE
jgi:hypothetical protein